MVILQKKLYKTYLVSMKLNIYNWKIFKKHFPKISFFKKDLQEVLFKEISQYDLLVNIQVDSIDTVNIVFVTPKEIKQFNKDFRKEDTVTDVLSFVLEQNPLIGEIYICPEYIVGEYCYKEVLRTIVHGFLHLLGYEHMKHFTGKSRSKNHLQEDMFVKQESMLENIYNDLS
jgi:rRNA maturation RNase YbeY